MGQYDENEYGQEQESETMTEGEDEYEDDAEYASQGLPPDNGYGGKTYGSGNGDADDNWMSIPSQNDGYNEQSAQEPMPPQNAGYGDNGYGVAQNPQSPMPPQNNGNYGQSNGYGQNQMPPQNGQSPMPPNDGYNQYGYGQNAGYEDNGYGAAQNPMPPQNGDAQYGQGQMPPNDGYGYQQYGYGQDSNNGYGENQDAGQSTGGFDQFRGIGNADDDNDGQRIFAANVDEDKSEVDIESDINIIDQKPNIGRTLKFGYAEIFIVFICIVLLVCGAALCYTRRKDEKWLKLMDNEPEYSVGYATFEQV